MFFKNPFFYFGLLSLFLLGLLFFSSESLAELSYFGNGQTVFFNPFFKDNDNSGSNDLFFSRQKFLTRETPDLKIIQDSFIYGISTPRVLTTQTLGDIFGELSDKKEVITYVVQPGDTIESLAQNFNISANTLLWANNLSANSSLKVGQSLTILPVSGLFHIVRSGDTVSQISKTYQAKVDDIIAFNSLKNEGDIFIGDILVVPDGAMPKKLPPTLVQGPLADSFFIYPTEGRISQGLHWYNAVDLANKCGTSVYAAASGVIQRVRYGWNGGGGIYITILHSDNIVTYYGHLMSSFVSSGDRVNVGDRIALVGQTGKSTGCHLHFEVIGARNPFAGHSVGSVIKYKEEN